MVAVDYGTLEVVAEEENAKVEAGQAVLVLESERLISLAVGASIAVFALEHVRAAVDAPVVFEFAAVLVAVACIVAASGEVRWLVVVHMRTVTGVEDSMADVLAWLLRLLVASTWALAGEPCV